MALIHELLPVMRSCPDPRVISVLSGIFWCVVRGACVVCVKSTQTTKHIHVYAGLAKHQTPVILCVFQTPLILCVGVLFRVLFCVGAFKTPTHKY
jgi:hypothetical protein